MQVILIERVKHLGNVGEIVKVSDGFARNYLLPKKLALFADRKSEKFVEDKKRALSKKLVQEKQVAQDIKSKLDGQSLNLVKRVAGNGKLFGAVTVSDILVAFEQKKLDVERKWIHIANPIKSLGTFKVEAKIFPGVTATFNVLVEMDPNQIKEMEEKRVLAKQREQMEQEKLAREQQEAAARAEAGSEDSEES